MVRNIFHRFSVVALLFLFTSCAGAAEELRPFWDQFRQAVENNDQSKVAELTQFPLETRGPDDSDPVVPVSRVEFLTTIYDKAMGQFQDSVVVGGQRIDKNLKDAIVEKTALTAKDQPSADFAFILAMQFNRIGGHWKLGRIYLEEP
jgi:hypothetical protein